MMHKSRTSYAMPALIYALLVGTTFSPDLQPFLAKTFGAAPYGLPVALVSQAPSLSRFFPSRWPCTTSC
jgi:hypothetical protein